MNWRSVKSSNIDAVSYDPGTRILSIRFHGSGVYHYMDVPEYIIDEMIQAESVGKYFIQNVKGKYSFEKESKICPKCGGEMKIVKGTGPISHLWACTAPGCGFHEPVA
jgi:hypothetical protein